MVRLPVHGDPEFEVCRCVLYRNSRGRIAALFVVADEGQIVEESSPRGKNAARVMMTDKMGTLAFVQSIQKQDDLVEATEELLVLVKTGSFVWHVANRVEGERAMMLSTAKY